MSLTAAADGPVAAVSNFRKYSAVYDLLYRDKDYAAEADYVVRSIRAVRPQARGILELGSGTGKHGRLLAARGFDVHGIERSPDMVALARAAPTPASTVGTFACAVGDVRHVALERTFDAVIALFHVVSYQTTDDDLQATFASAARHLSAGGVFLFDVWHGPAVEAQNPVGRVKQASDEVWEVTRTARPQLDTGHHTVRVVYDIDCRERASGETVRFSEDHLMRYLFPAEIDALALQSGFRVVASEEFMTGHSPSSATWGVLYMLSKLGEA